MGFEKGFLRVGRIGGAPIRLHWSIPIGAVVLGRFKFVPWFWASFFALVLLHELGHAIMVRAARARVLAIDAHGAGGLCHWSGEVSDVERALIAWGGVFAQALVLIAAYAVLFLSGPPTTAMGAGIADAFTEGNLWLIAVNLIPIPGFDGAEAWPLFPALARRWRRWRADRRKRGQSIARARAEIAAHDELERWDDRDAPPDPVADELLRRVFGKERDKTKSSK